MRERAFKFLDCSSCRFFAPKLKPPSHAGRSPVFVGLCTGGPAPRWAVWPGLERAAAGTGECSDREARDGATALCPLFDTTVESASLPYPQSCVHRGAPGCRLAEA